MEKRQRPYVRKPYTYWEKDESGQWWWHGRVERLRGEERTCAVCGNKFKVKLSRITKRNPGLYCSRLCANRAVKPRRQIRGETHPNWRGGRAKQGKDGYILIRVNEEGYSNGYMLEHRYVMSKYMGRTLFNYETVHHKNGNVTDNRIENLELRVGRHGRGATEKHCPTCTCFEKHSCPTR